MFNLERRDCSTCAAEVFNLVRYIHGDNKQDIILHGRSLWQRVYEIASSVINKDRIVVVGKDVVGGETRSLSVIQGLEALPRDTDKVIILESARPLVTVDQILQLLNCKHHSVSFVRPLVNTVVYRNGN